jgi:multiple sugar transport system substrate-binding protein
VRKRTTFALFALLVLLTLPVAAEPIRLLMWGGVPPEAGPQQVCDLFNKEFASKGISIEYERFVNDDQGNMKLETNLLAGGDIDIYVTYTMDRLRKRALGNMALNLEALMQKSGFNLESAIGPEGAMISRIDGKTFGVASKTYNNGFWVNKNMFDAAGIPIPKSWTLDEFRAVAKKLTKGSGDSKVYGAFLQTNSYKTLALEFGGVNLGGNAAFSKDRKSTALDNPVYEKALGTIVGMMQEGSIPSHADSISQKLQGAALFTSGKVAMVYGSWLYRDIKNLATYPHDFVSAYVPLPSDNTKAYYMNGGPGDQICINPKSKNIEAAWTFVKWYVEGGIIPLAPFGRFPLYTKVDMNKLAAAALAGVEGVFDRNSTVNGFLTPAKSFQVETFSDPQVIAVITEEFELAMLGSKSVKQALADAKKRSDPILAAKP